MLWPASLGGIAQSTRGRGCLSGIRRASNAVSARRSDFSGGDRAQQDQEGVQYGLLTRCTPQHRTRDSCDGVVAGLLLFGTTGPPRSHPMREISIVTHLPPFLAFCRWRAVRKCSHAPPTNVTCLPRETEAEARRRAAPCQNRAFGGCGVEAGPGCCHAAPHTIRMPHVQYNAALSRGALQEKCEHK